MRTPYDDLVADIRSRVHHEFDDGVLSKEEMESAVSSVSKDIMEYCWKYLEEYRVDFDGRFIFEYGMLKHLFHGSPSEEG